jgi:iron complex transport system permease protein
VTAVKAATSKDGEVIELPRGRTLRARRISLRFHPRTVTVVIALAVVVFALVVVATGTGDFPIAPLDVIRTLVGAGDRVNDFIIFGLRLPRVLVAVMCGITLGMAGAIFQSLSKNPLGSPEIVGFTNGSATGALVMILIFGGDQTGIALGAVGSGAVTAALVYVLAFKRGAQGYRLILVGIAVGAALTSVNSYLLTRARVDDAQQAAVWLIGSLNARSWTQVWPLAIGMLLLVPAALALGRGLDTLEMGDDAARALGVRVESTRGWLLVVGVGLTAAATAAAGPIGFVALAAPHLARRLTRAAGAGLVPAGLMGAVLLLVSDQAAQRLIPGVQLPVGVMTGAVGGLYLIGLLAMQWKRGRTTA